MNNTITNKKIRDAIFLDVANLSTREEDEFLFALTEAETVTRWMRVKSDALSVTGPDEFCDLPDDVFQEVMEHSPYGVTALFEDEYGVKSEMSFMLRVSAVEDIFARAKEGLRSGINVLPDHRDILSRIYKELKETYIVLIRGERLAALHSDRYAPIKQTEIFEMVKDYLENQAEGHFTLGEFSNEYTRALYEITDQGLVKEYADALDAFGMNPTNAAITAGLRVSTSDVGTASVRFTPYIKKGGCVLMLGNHFAVKHIGSADLEDVKKKLDGVFMRYTQSVKDLVRLMSIKLVKPYNAILNAGEKLRLPMKSLSDYVDAIQAAGRFENGASAYECYEVLNEILATSAAGIEPQRRFNLEEGIYQALSYDWVKLDRAVIKRA